MIRPMVKREVTGALTAVALLTALCLTACDGDSKAKTSDGGEAPEGATMNAVAGAQGGEMGAVMAPEAGEMGGMSVMEGGDMVAGTPVGGEEPPPPPAFCPDEIMEVQQSRGFTLPYPVFSGIDDRSDSARWSINVGMVVAARAGSYSLEGSTPDDCFICASIGYNCTQNGCAARFFATEGTVVVTEMGDGGDRLTGTILEAKFMQIGAGNTLREPDMPVCLQEQEFDVVLPALVDDVVPNYKLQNCETGVMENLYTKTQDQNGLWMIATAGWCPACRQHLNDIHNNNLETLEQGRVKPMFVVIENDSYEPATVEFCRAYGRRYADDSSNFYVDPNLDMTSKNIWRYTQPDGSWGIPWNNLIEGGDSNVLLYSDNEGPRSGLTQTLNELLNR